ncbi:MAG: hypothetical protein V7746_18275 [Halioglobus sp.]
MGSIKKISDFTPLRWLPAMLVFVVIAYYLWFVFQHALNIPQGDDITDILLTIIRTEKAEDSGEFLAAFLAQLNDHRTVPSRMVYWLSYKLQGEINFRSLTFLANAGLLLLFSMLVIMTRQVKSRWWILLCAAFLLFQIRAYHLTLWPMAAFAYFYVFVYGIASLCCLHRVTGARFFAAVVFATLCTFNLASGQVIWLVGFASLFLQAVISKRISVYYLPAWLFAAATVLYGWRIGMETPNTITEVLRLFLQTPLHHCHYLLSLLGSAVSEKSVTMAAIAGAVMLGFLLLSTVRHFRHGDLRLELSCWFIVFSAIALALGRAPYSSLEYALVSRYSFPSVVLLTFCCVLIASRFFSDKPKLILLTAITAAVYCVSSYRIYSPPLQSKAEVRVQRFNRGNFRIFGTPIAKSNTIVAEAVAKGVYTPPDRPYPRPVIATRSNAEEKASKKR